jgi:hypothetical protein
MMETDPVAAAMAFIGGVLLHFAILRILEHLKGVFEPWR